MDLASASKVFSAMFGVVYFAVFYSSWSPFFFYPEQNAFHFAKQPASAGPPILWYGWLAVAAVVSGVMAAIVPGKLVRKLPPAVFWVVPALVVLVVFFYEKRWFL